MHFELEHVYHLYNRGNNSTKIFFNKENYQFFLRKVRKEIKPFCEILAYCLMPNHFHFLVQATEISCETNKQGIQILARKFGTLLSSYTQAINKQNCTTGSLFQQKTKAQDLKQIITSPNNYNDYLKTCFLYIHSNPVKAKIVETVQEWPYSSFRDYIGIQEDILCNQELAFMLLGVEKENMEHFLDKAHSTKRPTA